MAVEKYGASRTDVVVKLVLVFFISLLSFSIGTFVGKKFSDNQHKISQLEPQGEKDGEGRDVASVGHEENDVKPKEALNDEEIKKLAEEFVADDETKKGEHGEKAGVKEEGVHAEHAGDKHETEHAGKGTEAAAEHGETAHGETHAAAPTEGHGEAATHSEAAKHAPSTAAQRVAAGEAPEAVVAEATVPRSRMPQSLPKELAASAIGKYTVQVASYPTEEEAQKMASELKEKGFSAFYVSAKIKDKASGAEKTWYRVSVGVFTTQKEADTYKADLLARAKVSSAIVQKITK